MILKYINQPYSRVHTTQTGGETRRDEFRNLNPIGKIPTVRLENGDVITESNAILYFFASATPLWPDELRSQTEVLRWLFFEQHSHEPTLSVIRYLNLYTDNPEEHIEEIEALLPKARHALDVMEKHLIDNRWFVPYGCSIADYALYPYTKLATEAGFNLSEYPAIERWLKRLEGQENFINLRVEGADKVLTFSEYFHNNAQ